MGAVLSFVCPELRGSFVRVFEDNQGAISLVANPLSSARSKHIDVRMYVLFVFFVTNAPCEQSLNRSPADDTNCKVKQCGTRSIPCQVCPLSRLSLLLTCVGCLEIQEQLYSTTIKKEATKGDGWDFSSHPVPCFLIVDTPPK